MMTERTQQAERNQGGTKRESAAAAAGQTPASKPQRIEDADAVPLSEGAVRNGGGYMGGESPADAEDDVSEPRRPLDSREAFGGDGAHYVDPAIESEKTLDSAEQARSNGTAPGEIGYDAEAAAAPRQEA
jgi:hypothetical protein